ncbi:MAG: cyclic nucleotide-binding domain-containing protein [Endomicrobiaceae bacterium]|jgi:signal-transduction protein with cAMP-binding, CBS, and nucleotidyltransferase domain|nr:cyclic nucleotide-binding domain-containing protein [Endomicrobiaceae bacterium]
MLKKIFVKLFVNTEIKDDIEFLSNISFFSKLTSWELKKVISIMYKKEYLKGEVIYNKGEDSKLFCILKKGKVELFDGKDKKNLEANDIFGQKSLMNENAVYANTATVQEKSLVYIIYKYDFERLMAADTRIGFKIAKILLDNLYDRYNNNL